MAKQNIKSATKKAQMNSLIDNMVAGAGTDKGAFSFNLSIVEEIVAEFIENVKVDINAIKDHMMTGNIQELTLRVNKMNEIEVLSLYDYIIYQSRGVNGTQQNNGSVHSYSNLKPPVQPFIDFIKQRKILTRYADKFYDNVAFEGYDEDRQIQQLAFAIRENVYKKGIKGKGYWDKNVDLLKQELNNRVAQNLGDQIKYRIYNKYGDNVQKKK